MRRFGKGISMVLPSVIDQSYITANPLSSEATETYRKSSETVSPRRGGGNSDDLPSWTRKSDIQIKIESGLENAPFLQQYKGKNAVHEHDREKASSILHNLVFMPMRDMGKFKFIFSKRLREKYFSKLDKAVFNIKEEEKIDIG